MTPSIPSTSSTADNTQRGPFALMTLLFFLWGFMTVWNDLLIPRFKAAFSLSYMQAMLVQSAFFGAYAIGSLAYYATSVLHGDPINRIGYKNGVVIGLAVSAIGSALFYPAASLESYELFLVALFIVGLGFAMLQIAANPYVTILGPERTASSRLNLSQTFNSLGTTIGPVVGGWLIFEVFSSPEAHGADALKLPYVALAAAFIVLAVIFSALRLPSFRSADAATKPGEILKQPQLVFGVGAIFMYVGGEVSVGSAIISFLEQPAVVGLSHEAASHYLSYYWGGLMIGRLMAAFSLSDLRPGLKSLICAIIPVCTFAAIVLIGRVTGDAASRGVDSSSAFALSSDAKYIGGLLALLLATFYAAGRSPQRMIAVFAGMVLVLLGVAILKHGETAKWAVLGIGLFCSVMWSNIFSLAIRGLGSLKSQGSSLLIMAILGGAVLPPLQGAIADRTSLQISFIVPALAFVYVAFYGLYGYRVRKPIAAE